MTQKFKGDSVELKMELAGAGPFDLVSASLDLFNAGAYNANDFLLMLYDEGRMPFSDRVPRDLFVAFIREAIPNFKFTGTFESYIFILKSIFGEGSEVYFDVPAAGKVEILVSIASSLDFDWQAREFSGGAFSYFEMQTLDGETIQFRGIAGIESEAELTQLLSELIPVGIYPTVTLEVFAISYFGAEDSLGVIDSVVDDDGNQIIFFETGA